MFVAVIALIALHFARRKRVFPRIVVSLVRASELVWHASDDARTSGELFAHENAKQCVK